MKTIILEEMTWKEIDEAIKGGFESVLIPLGAIEQHGPHLPTFMDTWLGYSLCAPIASKVGGMLLAPPVYPGRSEHHMAFPGTISVSSETFKAMVTDYCHSLARHGFKNLVLLATHGGNNKALSEVLPDIKAALPEKMVFGVSGADAQAVSQYVNRILNLDPDKCGRHAGLTETSMLLATRPELVHMENAVEGWMGGYGPEFSEKLTEGGMKAFSEYGILGDPREATAEKGIKIIDERAKGYALLIRKALGLNDDLSDTTYKPLGRHTLDRKLLLEEMTWQEIGEAIQTGWDTVCVMLGSIEQHGPHLPIGTDTMLGYERGVRLALELGHALVAPVVRPGLSEHHMKFPGTITLRRETFDRLVIEFCISLGAHGFKNLILLPTHGGNYGAAAELLPRVIEALPDTRVILFGRDESRMAHKEIQPLLNLDPQRAGVHAGRMETSFMLSHRPDLVKMEEAQEGWVGDFDDEAAKKLSSGGIHSFSSVGILGDPRGATAELGDSYLQAWTNIYARIAREKLHHL